MDSVLIAAYGTLKKGFYNHRLLQNAEYLGTTNVRGVMFLRGGYPILVHPTSEQAAAAPWPLTEDAARDHTAEVYRVPTEDAAPVDRMEVGAGYDIESIETEWGPATVYFMPAERVSEFDRPIDDYTQEVLNTL